MKVGIYQTPFLRYGSFQEQINKMRFHQFEAMDFQELDAYGSRLYTLPPSAFEATLKDYGKTAREGGVEISQVHGPYSYPQLDNTPELVAKKLELTYRAIEGTALLGCRKMVIHPLFPHSSHDLSHAEETWEANLTFLQKVCDKAGECGVLICLENMPSLRFSLATVPDVLRIVKALNHPQLRVCLDTGHCAVFEYSPGKAVRQIGGKLLGALHIHDNNGKEDQHKLPYDGIIDWMDFAHALREVNFSGVLSLETGYKKNLPEHLHEAYLHYAHETVAYIRELARQSK